MVEPTLRLFKPLVRLRLVCQQRAWKELPVVQAIRPGIAKSTSSEG
jgi:hypothetical protein